MLNDWTSAWMSIIVAAGGQQCRGCGSAVANYLPWKTQNSSQLYFPVIIKGKLDVLSIVPLSQISLWAG